ncbi:MAG: class I SAM-dependent methyltransferase [Planctomycetota bacterium]|jgi:SAM-dependent methyltransferase
MPADFAKTATDYARHRVGFPDRFFEEITRAGLLRRGNRALDLGTGTGLIARELARRGMEVTGLDRAAPLLDQAKRLDREAGLVIPYLLAPAEDMGLEPHSYDLVLAGQCWHWFDRPKVLEQVASALAPGGKLLIAHFDWLPLPESLVAATEELILKYSPAWELGGGTGLYPHWLPELMTAGFREIETHSFDCTVEYSHDAWRGRIRASAGVAASLAPTEVLAFDEEHRALLATRFPGNPMQVPHRAWWAFCCRPK